MLVCGPKRPFLLRYESRDTRRIDFPQVDGLSTGPLVLGRHKQLATEFSYVSTFCSNIFLPLLFPFYSIFKVRNGNGHFYFCDVINK